MTVIAVPHTEPIEQSTEHPHIVRVENVPTLRGTRLSVRLIAQMYRAGDSVDDILHSYPQLSVAVVHDAISYYLDHRADIEQEIATHRIEVVLTQTGGQMDERGFITFPDKPVNG